MLWLGLGGSAAAAATLGEWQNEAARVRVLAENDAPRAYEEARQLQAALAADAPAADRARVLNLLSRIEAYLALTEPSAEHAQRAFDLATEHGDRVGQAEAHLNVALNAINQGRLDAMVTATNQSVTVLEGVDRPDLLGEALLRMTVMYRRFEQFEECVAVAVQAMEIARRSNNALALTFAHQGLALAFDQSFRVAEMREHHQQMRFQAQLAHSRLLEAFAVMGLAGAATSSGDLAGGERSSREAVALFRAVGAPFAESFGQYGLAENLRQQGRHDEALALLDDNLTIYAKYPNRIGLWFSLNARSALYETLGNIVAAGADAERAYAVAKDLGHAIYTSGSALRLAAIAAASGDHQRAYALSVEARELSSKATREKAGVRMLQLVKRYESEGRQRQIDELTRRNQQQTAELRQRELQQRWLWTVLAASVAVSAVAAYFLQRLRRSHRLLAELNAQLEHSRDAIRDLNAGLEERVQARTAQLRQQARYLRTLIDMLPMWAWFKDTKSRYLVTNHAHAQARGHSAEEMVGKSDFELLPPELAHTSQADDAQVMADRERKTAEEPISDGTGIVWMETYKAPVLDDDGTLLGTVGVARNVSERKATEAAREAALSEARRLARLRSDFLAQMSHELRTPMNAILGFAQLLQGDRQLNEQQARGVAMIRQSGQHLLALINDILDLTRIDAGKLELHPAEVELSAFLLVVADIIRVKADEKKLQFSVQTAADLPGSVRIDEMRLRQILLNLLSNAVKFTDTGHVTLRVRTVSPPQQDSQGATVRLRFEVEDSGIGMNGAQLARIFQPFEQVADLQRRSDGAGLGLAISRQLVRLMGGDIQVSSDAGKGSRFWFELDLAGRESQAAAAFALGRVVGYEGPRRKILVVDDAPQLRALLADALGVAGFVVEEASDGQQGLERAQAWRPDLVVMDVSMPVMDGLEATRRLRQLSGLEHVPIIQTSASGAPDAEARSLACGADAFMPKPIDQTGLMKAIGQHLALNWIHEGAAPAGEPAPPAPPGDSDLVVPPPEEMEVLFRLARIGSMRDIRARADHLQALDPRYEAFSAQLRRLADGYQSRAIVALVEPYCEATTGPAPGLRPSVQSISRQGG